MTRNTKRIFITVVGFLIFGVAAINKYDPDIYEKTFNGEAYWNKQLRETAYWTANSEADLIECRGDMSRLTKNKQLVIRADMLKGLSQEEAEEEYGFALHVTQAGCRFAADMLTHYQKELVIVRHELSKYSIKPVVSDGKETISRDWFKPIDKQPNPFDQFDGLNDLK